jgi:hypothetical protein
MILFTLAMAFGVRLMGAAFTFGGVGVVGAFVVVEICTSSSLRTSIVAVFNRKLAQHIFDDLAHLAKGMVAGDGLQVLPVFAVNTTSRWFLAALSTSNTEMYRGARASVYPPLIPWWDINTPAVERCSRVLANASWGNP